MKNLYSVILCLGLGMFAPPIVMGNVATCPCFQSVGKVIAMTHQTLRGYSPDSVSYFLYTPLTGEYPNVFSVFNVNLTDPENTWVNLIVIQRPNTSTPECYFLGVRDNQIVYEKEVMGLNPGQVEACVRGIDLTRLTLSRLPFTEPN